MTLSAEPGPGLPLNNSYYCVVTDGAGYTKQSNTVTLTTNPLPSAPVLYQWGETTDHVWVQLDSADGLGINYQYSDDGGNGWSGWRNDGYSHFWPNVGPLGLPSGSVVVQAYVVNGYGCSSSIAQDPLRELSLRIHPPCRGNAGLRVSDGQLRDRLTSELR